MRKISADFIFPVSSPPIKNGVVVIDESGRVLSVNERGNFSDVVLEIYEGIICPGFVNAHCHLELSYLKNKISQHKGLDEFIKEIEHIRNAFSEKDIANAMIDAENEMMENGIVAVGDISNDEFSFELKSKRKIFYHTFIELFGFHPSRADSALQKGEQLAARLKSSELAYSITPHAPYSVSEKLLEQINANSENKILSVHHLENQDELEMFLFGKGKIFHRLKQLGIDTSFWKPPGERPLEWLLPKIKSAEKILLVHNTFLNQADLDFLKYHCSNFTAHIFFCLCPNANVYIENKLPDINLIAQSGFDVCIGTDSLASNKTLSILDEMKTIQNNFPKIELHTLIEWATSNGARFLGVENKFGSFEIGKTPGVNLIQNADVKNLRLTPHSKIKKLA